ncbi:hypothetical protein J437_LFUL019369 [Ladona fulva]|uniref:Reverse transcriptase domain-containing protein n=1 Tax=Ladona fulva TaxID=123851 RepID=A0A8K0K3Z2_LADFU|nr:hypothetical protein J437_LFUL019369 [Ladona fulva]
MVDTVREEHNVNNRVNSKIRKGRERIEADRKLFAIPEEVLHTRNKKPSIPSPQEEPTEEQMIWLIELGIRMHGDKELIHRIAAEMTNAATALSTTKQRSARQKHQLTEEELIPQEIQSLYQRRKKAAFQKITSIPPLICPISINKITQHFNHQPPPFSKGPAPSIIPAMKVQRIDGEEDLLCKNISAKEVQDRLKRAADSSPGPDGIPYKAWRKIDPTGSILAALFSACLDEEIVLAEWKHSCTILLHKGGEPEDIENWRPIALQPTLGKIFSGILADRIYSWAIKGCRLSFPFQKGFIPGTEGCFEHNFLLGTAMDDARRNGKEIAIAWLDLADAFGSVPHKHIIRTLQDMEMPNSIIRLICNIYEGVTTKIEAKDGTTDPIPISSGVRQGDPLSPLLFNLALEPLLRTALSKGMTAGYQLGKEKLVILAYADDIVLMAKSAGALHQILHSVSTAATWSGLSFKPRKCASLHLDCTKGRRQLLPSSFDIQGRAMRTLKEGESYKYLGAPLGWHVTATPTEAIATLKDEIRAISNSNLAPWQKLDATRTFLLPKLEYPMRISDFPKGALNELEKQLYTAGRSWMWLPQRSSREALHLPPHLGGGGLFPPSVLKDILTVAHGFKMLTCADPLTKGIAWESLRDRLHKKLEGEPRSQQILPSWNTSQAPWRIASELTLEMQHPSGQECGRQLAPSAHTPQHLGNGAIPGRRKAVPLLKKAAEEGWRRALVQKKDQGKVPDAVSLHPASSHFIREGRNTRFCDWRFVHRARLNVLPLNGARHGNQRGDSRCRRCGAWDETLPHVLNHCASHSDGWTRRHNEIQNILINAFPSTHRVQIDRRIPEDESLLRPDILVSEGPQGPYHIIDVTVPFENRRDALGKAREGKISKYMELAERLRVRHRYQVDVFLDALVVGALGSWDPANDRVLQNLRIPDRKIPALRRKMVSIAIKWSRDIYVEHITGDRQYKATPADTGPDGEPLGDPLERHPRTV